MQRACILHALVLSLHPPLQPLTAGVRHSTEGPDVLALYKEAEGKWRVSLLSLPSK